ncbi:MAG: LacI family DNA-binding transcriptional regulator [Dysgonamonadaceae bacterium]|jgi:LacI family transcriptional regulator|nr:LacI family DNA-binding transcriptional regulator [Dysgonamonadaceae bacterium]
MNSIPQKIKIKDIAEKAGVSAGTVDRVLHDRGNVSDETKRKIQAILNEINYRPNHYASALASKKVFVFCAVIPNCEPGGYWELVEQGLLRAEQELYDFKVVVKVYHFDQYSPDSFAEAMEAVLQQTPVPDAVLLAPLYKPKTMIYTKKMEEREIPYVFIDSRVEEANPLAFYGQDSLQSGYLGAKLLFSQCSDTDKIAIFSFFDPGQTLSNQIALRMDGFKSYVSKNNLSCKIVRGTLSANDQEENVSMMKKLFKENPDIKGAAIFSSRAYVVAGFLEKYKLNHVTMIGYDLLEKNVKYLKNNTISYLIAQRPEEQAYKGIKAFSEHFIFKKNVPQINYMPIDILTQENIKFYLEQSQ